MVRCKQNDTLQLISSIEGNAESVFLTQDEQGKPVVAWTERKSDSLTFHFSVSHDNGNSFADEHSFALSEDVATHAESMPKVAFKKDGTIIVAFEKRTPTEKNKYAGAIFYRASSDGGMSWTPERFLHSDTVRGRIRSYFDIERLPDGEIGAAWLDIKLNLETGGRSVRFAKTNRSTTFDNEILIDSSACQCCRIDVYSDITKQIHIAYRGLSNGVMGQPVRDMMIAASQNGGSNFSKPRKISHDNWTIDGCPHTGPSLCSGKGGLYSMWYTEGNGTGIYYSFKDNEADQFSNRQLLTNTGRHPQASAAEDRFIMVWEENADSVNANFTHVYCQVSDGEVNKRLSISPHDANAFLPVVTQTRNGFLVAMLMERDHKIGMYTIKL